MVEDKAEVVQSSVCGLGGVPQAYASWYGMPKRSALDAERWNLSIIQGPAEATAPSAEA